MVDIRQKILITKLDLEFTPRSWWIRSTLKSFYGNWVIYVNFYGYIDYNRAHYNYGIAPACAI